MPKDGERADGESGKRRIKRHPVPKLFTEPIIIQTCGGQVIIDAERKNGHLLVRVDMPDIPLTNNQTIP